MYFSSSKQRNSQTNETPAGSLDLRHMVNLSFCAESGCQNRNDY